MAMNVVSLVGRVSEASELTDGSAGTDLILLVAERCKVEGEWRTEQMPVSVTVGGKQGAACLDLLTEGSPVGIAGRLGRDQDGVRVIAQSVDFLDSLEVAA